jgi:L-asparaginase II
VRVVGWWASRCIGAPADRLPVMADAAVLAQAWRGEVLEAVIRGHVAVVDHDGTIVASAGDPATLTTMRSGVKALQAQAFTASAADTLGCPVAEVAIACASHDGEPRHVETVRSLLHRAGLDESALLCGPQQPFNRAAARDVIAAGLPFLPVHNNCSGKHAAMLATCAVEGWPLEGYADYGHPVQQAVRTAFRDVAGCDLNTAPSGIDGCGVPTYGVAVAALAQALATAARRSGFRRCQDAMAAEPFLIGGTGEFDTVLLEEFGADITGKSGGAAVWAGVLRPVGPGIAVKLEAGAGEYLAPVVTAVLQALDAVPAALPEPLRRFARPILRNLANADVGVVVSCVQL